MGKKSVATRGSSRQQRTLRHGVHIELMMECIEEGLSQSQLDAFKKADNEYKAAMAKIKDANRREKEGTAIVITQARHGMPLPPPQLSATVYPQPQQPATRLTNQFQAQKPPDKPPPRSDSPDLIIVGETPPPAKPTPVQKPTPPQARLQPITQTHVTRILTDQTATRKGDFPHVYQFVNLQGQPVSQGKHQTQIISVMKPVAPVVPQQQQTRPLVNMQYITTNTVSNNKTALKNNEVILGNHGLGIKRVSDEDTGPAKKKKKPIETDESGNWVPLDEYYYSKKEGDPTYTEEKGEYRFKCWYCSKMLYNNVKAMMHLQGHIDSGRQHNLDLTDLTQCKHCYKQFDTPFEMQTHVEKVHMSNTNVLMCRICERDLDSRQALTTHMRQNHNACEMPYLCQLCNFRSSMYSDVVDHFKKKHDSSQNILCLYCLRVFKVKFVSQGWGQTQTYYGHLLKHQSKTSAKKCNLCRLTFFNPVDVKAHKKKDHLPNHKGIQGTAIHTSPGQVMIKVPESGLHVKQQNLKSLNAPAVSKVLDFGGTKLPVLVNYLTCLECKTSMGTPDHFKKHIECSMCRFATSCSIAYANHMMGFHSGQMSSLNLNIPWERKMKCHLYCLCGFGSRYGNNIANHLVFCAKRTCYLQKPDVIPDDNISDEDVDPRHKPGASILDVLGLVKKRTVSTKETVDKDSVEMDKLNEIRRRTRENSPPPKSPPPSVRRKPRDITPPKSPVETKEENVPEELKGAQKWNTVKIKDTKQPSKASVFLGGVIDDVQESPGSTIPLEENEESQTKKLNESADGDQKDAEDCPMKVEHGDLTVKNTESTAENSKSIDGNNEPSGKDDESTSKDAESVGECSESNSESTKSTYLSAELTSKKVDNSDEHKIEDSLLNQTEDEPNDDNDSKLDDSVLEHQDSVTMVNDGLKEHSGNDSKMEASETNSEAGVTSELACTQSNVEQSELVSLENANKVDIKSSATDCDISVNNAGSIEGDKGVDNLKPSIEVTNSDEAESSSNDQSEHLKPSKDESKKNKENDNNQVTEDNNSVGNDGEQIQTEHKSQEVGNTTEQKSGEKDNKEPSHEESQEINTVTKETKHSEQPEENKTSEIESGENSKVNNKNKPEDNVKIDEEKDVKSTTTNTDHRKSGSVEDIKSTTTNTDHRKSGSVEDVKSTTTNTDHRKSGSVEKEYKSESKEHKYEERQENEEHSKHHGEGRSYESHRQDYHRSSEGHRHSDRSNDRDYYRDRDHHYRDREQYRDGDRYHDRNYHGHHNDRNFNRHGAGYYSNQSHGSGRWDDRQDDYRNRYRDYDRYQRGRRGGGYGHHSNYR